MCCARSAVAEPIAQTARSPAIQSTLLARPGGDGPVAVHASFHLLNISSIDDDAESVDFSGVLTLVWQDTRQAFDPVKEGVSEKVVSGAYQFNEISPAWYPQVTLANTAGRYDSRTVLLRVKPDGTSKLMETVDAVAIVHLNLRPYPFDHQRLEAVFEVSGFSVDEVVLVTDPGAATLDDTMIHLPQYALNGASASIRALNAPYAGGTGASSAFVVTINVARRSLFMLRLVVLPLALIVMLSWSVFWMDRSSLGDRMSVSFVGILTAVAYQIVVGSTLPQISYFTFMNGFLNVSFLTMSASVVINLVVGAVDTHGHRRGDRIDRRCRWIFPLAYFGTIALALAAFVFF